MLESDLSEKDWQILDYIKENPGTSREGVVRGMNGNPSRITVLKILYKLEQYGSIVVTKDKPNSQIHHLFINKGDILISVIQNLNDFKKAFFILLDKTVERARLSSLDDIVTILSMLNREYIFFYYHVLWLYIMYGLSRWSKEITDRETINKLYVEIFSRIVDIQSKLFDVNEIINSINRHVSYVYYEDDLVNSLPKWLSSLSLFSLTPDFITQILEKSKKYGLDKEVESVLDVAWKIGYDIGPFDDSIFGSILEYKIKKGLKGSLFDDWRKVVRIWKYELKREDR